MKSINKLKATLVVICASIMLTACSKPDISGVWIPENTTPDSTYYNFYEIKKKDNSDRYQLIETSYKIKSTFGDKVPRLLDKRAYKVLEFTKDNTYCVEGSLNTECVVAVDGKLDIYNHGRFVKSKSNTPPIPVNN